MEHESHDRRRGLTRRDVLRIGACSALGMAGLRRAGAAERRPLAERPQAPPHSLDTIPWTTIPVRFFPNFWRMHFVR